ncbi:Integrase, catalytic core domain-containing protein [Rozella allomycis CSF55]|uniref:Integrase, catalytic core domain-containing protein n=1 Tax=Rozella allomycis (strain CSF55) TaxID=988480 RepID=A0A075B3L7_ROZAC|nr:Integrase, catalytic core domain-containing protein [Rozella allomycis CSF55]|eukprot:EPZ35576.1 Integrase, catalytic core domain-containing protein [Rozella allomycis CSF55]
MVRGIPNFSEGEHLAFCEICARNKSKRVPFKGKRPQAKDIGEVLHTDLCGPMQVETPSGKRYVHVVIDDFSRMCWIRLLRNKAEAKVTLREIITFIETQSGRKVKTVRSDRGGEFVDGDLQKYFTEKGIKHYLTDKYTPEMNGTAERKNGLLMAAARCLLRQAGLPDTFWGEMVNTACYLQNRTPTSILGNITPVEAFTGEKPSVAHLRTIGTKCFVYIPKIKRQKLDEQAEEHTLVGYDISERNYRLRVGKTNRVIVSTHVKFTNIQQELNKMKYTNLEDDLLDNEIDEEIKMNQETSTNKQYDFKEELNKLLINSNIQKHNKNNEENTNVEKEPIQPRPRNLRNLERKDYAELSNFKDVALLSTDRISEIPRNVKEALSGAEANEWKQAMETEYKSLEENKTWKLCELPASRTAVGCRWVFAKKFDSEGKLQRYKARLVAQGFSQRPGIDVEQTYAPVTRIQSVRILIALGVQLDWHMHQMDMVTAYLNGTLDTMIYMKQPEGFIKEGSENLVCDLQKSLYGLKQSGRLWNIKIDCDLRKNGFKRCRADWCIYVKQENGVIIVIAIYVDDIIIMSKEIELINKTKDLLKTLYKVKDMGNIGWCLGIKINRIGENVTELSQKQYIKEKLEIFGMSDCKPIGTPMETGIKYGAWMSPKTQAEKEEMKDIPYREAVGNLQWLANMTRPDIAQAVGVASRFCQNPGVQHWKLVKRIFRYLAGTINKTLIFKKAKNEGVAKLELIGYCDADWASDVDSRKSTTGYIFFINGNAVTWRSRIQRTNALSSTEAEYMAITEAVKEGKWIQKLLKELKVWKKLQNKFIKIMEDNQGAIKLAENPISHDRTKHIDNQFHLIRDLIECKKLKIEYLNTKEMIADIMTKAVSKSDYEKHVESMNVREETVVKNNNSASGGIRELNTKLRSDKNTELSLVNKEPSDQMINSPN